MNKKERDQIGAYLIIILITTSISATVFLTTPSEGQYTYDIHTFQTYDEYYRFIIQARESDQNYKNLCVPNAMFFRCENSGVEYGATADMNVDYSDTNVQAAGVDEPDTIKTDGTYQYLITQGKIHIVLAYPSNNASIQRTLYIEENLYTISNSMIKIHDLSSLTEIASIPLI